MSEEQEVQKTPRQIAIEELHAASAESMETLVCLLNIASPCLRPVLESRLNFVESDAGLSLGVLHAPASVRRHHSVVGGLLNHYLEMWVLHCKLSSCDFMYEVHDKDREIMDAIIIHDLHKIDNIYMYEATNRFSYNKSAESLLLPQNYRTIRLMPKELQTPLMLNVIACAEGGWAKDPAQYASPLAKYIYLLDDMSANVVHAAESPDYAKCAALTGAALRKKAD